MQNELTLKPGRRQKLKLSFEQLEKEMELEGNILCSPMDLAEIAGGSSIDEILQYYQSLGFIFEIGSDGNYYGAQNITLENVTVTAHRSNSGSSLYNSGSRYQYFWDNINQIGWAATITGGGGGTGGSGTTSQSPISNYSKQVFLAGGTLTLVTSEVPPIAVAIATLTTVAAGAAWLYENWGTLKTSVQAQKLFFSCINKKILLIHEVMKLIQMKRLLALRFRDSRRPRDSNP